MARPPARPALLRTLNDRTVVELLLAHGALTRADIATLSGLSKPTAGEALTRLLAEGVVDHAGVSSGRPGPSAQAYAVDTRRVIAAAVTVTAKKIVLDVVDVAGDRLGPRETRRRATVPPAEAVRALLAEALPRPAARRRPRGLRPRRLRPRRGRRPLRRRHPRVDPPGLAAELRTLGIGHVTIDNDVNLAAVAERQQRFGPGRAGLRAPLDRRGPRPRPRHRRRPCTAAPPGSPARSATCPCAPTCATGRSAGDFQGLVGGPAVRALAKAHGLRGRSTSELVSGAVSARRRRRSSRSSPTGSPSASP